MKVHLSINWILGIVLSAYDFMPFTNKYMQMSINQSLEFSRPACEIMPFSGFHKYLTIIQNHQQAAVSFVGASVTQR